MGSKRGAGEDFDAAFRSVICDVSDASLVEMKHETMTMMMNWMMTMMTWKMTMTNQMMMKLKMNLTKTKTKRNLNCCCCCLNHCWMLVWHNYRGVRYSCSVHNIHHFLIRYTSRMNTNMFHWYF